LVFFGFEDQDAVVENLFIVLGGRRIMI